MNRSLFNEVETNTSARALTYTVAARLEHYYGQPRGGVLHDLPPRDAGDGRTP